MTALDNLKDVWKNQKESKIQFSETDIYKMIHKKSASIVKLIFYISIIEFILLIVVPFFIKDTSVSVNELHIATFYNITNIISYAVTILFVFIFYKNYKAICVQDTSKKLMKDILKTRKTVKLYVAVQLIIGAVTSIVLLYKISNTEEFLSNIPQNISATMLWVMFVGVILFILLLVWLFYKLIYGILLKQLNHNYKELLKNDYQS